MNYEEIAFEIIRYTAEAKSLLIEELDNVEKNITTDEDLTKQAHESLMKAHLAHSKLIQAEAQGVKHEFSLLIMHAEDQLMNVELLIELNSRFKKIYERINSCTS